MAAPKLPRILGGAATPSAQDLKAVQYDPPATPQDPAALAAALLQLQNTVNELISRFNAHTHVENTAAAYVQNASTAAPAAAQQVQGVAVAATNLFTAS